MSSLSAEGSREQKGTETIGDIVGGGADPDRVEDMKPRNMN